MASKLVCWQCGSSLKDEPLPLSRFAECRKCRSELHVCVMCKHYDPSYADACHEPNADLVKDKDRANFCTFFRARPGAYKRRDRSASDTALTELDSLFGSGSEFEQEDHSPEARVRRAEDEARAELKRLFDSEDD